MVFEGVVRNRAVVLPPEADLSEGTIVRIEAAANACMCVDACRQVGIPRLPAATLAAQAGHHQVCPTEVHPVFYVQMSGPCPGEHAVRHVPSRRG